MENRPLSVAALVIALLAVTFSAGAAGNEPDAGLVADWEMRLEKAAGLQREGQLRKAAANQVLENKKAACFKAFRVYACQEEAQAEYVLEANEARRMDNEGKAMERQVKKEQASDKSLRRAAEAPAREIELETRASETAAERKAAEEAEVATRASKAIQSEEGQKRRAAEAERQQKKRADHEARQARQMEKAARRAAEADAKAEK